MMTVDRTQPRIMHVLHQRRPVRVPMVGRRDAALSAVTVQKACDTMRSHVGRADVHPAAVMLKAAPQLVADESSPKSDRLSLALDWLSRLSPPIAESRAQRKAAALLKKPITADTQRALSTVVDACVKAAGTDATRGYHAFAGDLLVFGAELAVLAADARAEQLLTAALGNYEGGYAWATAQDQGRQRALLEAQSYAYERLADVALDSALLTADLQTQTDLLALADRSYESAWNALTRAREYGAWSPAGVVAVAHIPEKRVALAPLLDEQRRQGPVAGRQ